MPNETLKEVKNKISCLDTFADQRVAICNACILTLLLHVLVFAHSDMNRSSTKVFLFSLVTLNFFQ